MYRLRSLIATSLCVAYVVLTGLVPLVGLHHEFETRDDGAPHHAIDDCTWLEHAVGSSVCSGGDVDLNLLPLQQLVLYTPDDLYLSFLPHSIKARAPPALLS